MLTMLCVTPVYSAPDESKEPTYEASSEIYMENPNLEAPDTSHAEAVLLMDLKS